MKLVQNALHVLICALMSLCIVKCELKLTILHTNDMHARFEDTDAAAYNCKRECYGGFARLKTAVDQARQDAKNRGREAIFMNAGDTFAGSIFFIRFSSQVVIPMLQSLGIDIMSLGNHEFDGHTKMLADYIEKINIPVVCSNIDISAEPAFKNKNTKNFTPSKVLEIGPNKVKVGVIGYLTNTGTENLNQVKLFEEIEPIKREVDKLKKQGVKIFIALGHSGYDVDQNIARLVPDLDIVVGGHTDTFLYTGAELPSTEQPEGPYPTIVTQEGTSRKVLVVQAFGYTKYLGKLEVTFDDDGEIIQDQTSGNPILVDDTYKKDPAVTAILKPFWDILIEDKVLRVIGHTSVFLAGALFCLRKECNLGNLIADAYVYGNQINHKGPGWTDAAIGVMNAGGIRMSIDTEKYESSDLTFLLLSTSLIYTNPLVKITLNGTEIKQMLEHSVYNVHDPHDWPKQFLQVSGVHVVYDLDKPVSQRVISVKVLCAECSIPKYKKLRDEHHYKIVTTRYLANGHEGYDVLKNAHKKEVITHLNNERHAVEVYLSHVNTVYPAVEGRIKFEKKAKKPNEVDHKEVHTLSTKLTKLLKMTDSIRSKLMNKIPKSGNMVSSLLPQTLKNHFGSEEAEEAEG